VTTAEIYGRDAQDSPILPSLLTTTRRHSTSRVSADKGYSSIANVETIAAMGATPFISYKAGHNGKGGGMWEKMFQLLPIQTRGFF